MRLKMPSNPMSVVLIDLEWMYQYEFFRLNLFQKELIEGCKSWLWSSLAYLLYTVNRLSLLSQQVMLSQRNWMILMLLDRRIYCSRYGGAVVTFHPVDFTQETPKSQSDLHLPLMSTSSSSSQSSNCFPAIKLELADKLCWRGES